MKKFFTNLKDWFKRHKPSKRRLIQVYAALLYNANIKGFISGSIYKGPVKNACVPGLNCYSCPGAAGACPLGALQNALASSGTTAPFYVIGILLLMGLIFGRTICGFLCPVGLGQELLYKIKTPKLKKSRYTRIASYLKYVILIVMVIAIPLAFGLNGYPVPAFCKYLCPAGTFGGGIGLLVNPTNEGLIAQLGSLFTWKFAVFAAIAVASVFIFRFFCRFFCPLGALYGLFSRIALLGVKLDKNKCTDCGLCLNVCKMDIKRVGDHECIQCGECISACPAKAISWKGSKLFVHRNAVELAPPSEEKPLGALLGAEKTESVPAAAEAAEITSAVAEMSSNDASEQGAANAESAVEVAVKRQNKRNFWLQFAAWTAALALLVGALVYYNFIDKIVPRGRAEGDACPDFTVQLYDGEGGTFTFTERESKVTVINFWATWCGPCVAELPEFERLQNDYSYDEVEVIAIHVDTIDAQSYIAERGWSDYKLRFAQDNMTGEEGEVNLLLAEVDSLPVTLVINHYGIVAKNSPVSMTYETLKEQVEESLALCR